MDLFDKDKHFAHLVPLKALRDALLRNAIAAVAAKQLGRVKGHKLFGANQCQKPAMVRYYSGVGRCESAFADIRRWRSSSPLLRSIGSTKLPITTTKLLPARAHISLHFLVILPDQTALMRLLRP